MEPNEDTIELPSPIVTEEVYIYTEGQHKRLVAQITKLCENANLKIDYTYP